MARSTDLPSGCLRRSLWYRGQRDQSLSYVHSLVEPELPGISCASFESEVVDITYYESKHDLFIDDTSACVNFLANEF